jgi:hypothetical protein
LKLEGLRDLFNTLCHAPIGDTGERSQFGGLTTPKVQGVPPGMTSQSLDQA